MNLITIPAHNLKHMPHNARKLKNAKGIDKLAEQIRIHGFQNPLNVWLDPEDGKYAIIAGNHRFRAGHQIGMREFPCVVYEGTKEQAYSRSISDNKMSELTTWDYGEFSLSIADLNKNFLKISTITFDRDRGPCTKSICSNIHPGIWMDVFTHFSPGAFFGAPEPARLPPLISL